MASSQEVKKAREICRNFSAGFGRRHSRTHYETLEENNQRLRALEGICGNCHYLELEFRRGRIYLEVSLRCRAGLMPVELYRKTDLGSIPNCPRRL